jgi:hypothetical protein
MKEETIDREEFPVLADRVGPSVKTLVALNCSFDGDLR